MSITEAAIQPRTHRSCDAPPTGPIILIVDDSPVDRRLAAAIVAKSGLRAIAVSNGHEALDSIAREAPAVVLTDLQMPEMDGLELVENIRKLYPGIPVVLMTAHGSEEIAFRALRAGAASYVAKKEIARELTDTLASVLSAAVLDHRRQKLLRCLESTHSRFILDNDPEMIAPLIAALQEDLDGMKLCDGNQRTRVGVALQEAITNALYHGNLEVSSDLRQDDERNFLAEIETRRDRVPYKLRKIEVTALLDRDSATYIVRDEGPGFPLDQLSDPFDPESLMRVGGRGMVLIRAFMDEVHHNPSGNQITMVKRRKGASPVASAAPQVNS